MTVNKVTLSGSFGTAGFGASITFTPVNSLGAPVWLNDITDSVTYPPSAITVLVGPAGTWSVSLLATDNSVLDLNGGWAWSLKYVGRDGTSSNKMFLLPFSGGSSQNWAAIAAASPSTGITANLLRSNNLSDVSSSVTALQNIGGVNKLTRPVVTVSPAGVATGGSVVNNSADFGPDTPGTVTCGIQEAVNAAIASALGGKAPDVLLLPGIFKLSHFSETTYRSAVYVDAGYAGSAGPAISVKIKGSGLSMNPPEGQVFGNAYVHGSTVIDASALDSLSQGLFKQGRVFGVIPRATNWDDLVTHPTNAVHLSIEGMTIVVPVYTTGGSGAHYSAVGSLFLPGDTQSSNATHWEFVNGIDAYAASSFRVENVSVLSAVAAFNSLGTQYAGGAGVYSYGSAAGFVFPEEANQSNVWFENVATYDLFIGMYLCTHTAGTNYYSQASNKVFYYREPGHGVNIGRINPQGQITLIQHLLLNQLTNSLVGAYFDPVGDLYSPIGMSFPSSALPGVITISEAAIEGSLNNLLIDDPSNPLTAVVNVDHTSSYANSVWGAGANLLVNQIDTAGNSQTVVSGTTAGTVTYTQSGSTPWDKHFVAYLSGYRNSTPTPQTITFTLAYSHPPAVLKDDTSASTVASATLTLPASMGSPVTGYIILSGY